MGATAAAVVSKGSARKQGKKYLWGSERPGVLERRVQTRMEQLPRKLAAVEERVARFREAELAKIEAERIFLEHQQALLNEHREEVRAKKLLRVPDPGHHSEEEIAAVIARTPEIPLSDRAARQILDIIKSQAQVAEAPFDVVAVSHSGRIHVLETPNGRGKTDPVRSVAPAIKQPTRPSEMPHAEVGFANEVAYQEIQELNAKQQALNIRIKMLTEKHGTDRTAWPHQDYAEHNQISEELRAVRGKLIRKRDELEKRP
jgi:hypothetical protein